MFNSFSAIWLLGICCSNIRKISIYAAGCFAAAARTHEINNNMYLLNKIIRSDKDEKDYTRQINL